ncbi:AraC family transcriptional regulator [Flexivirga endophytica]|uniref:AraC family transcriptional regulator n=1 Tax=Flexivirga endophytica TaxID=1849103 RepID=A0A916TJA0_9MICO|nr:TatD family hydrolase [Flexivirga endophytica]GGB47871.1 AraC family transcriptional regulator [Flexivirga endophytica]GHB60825.1 AraC family transcriptional regulator [Flexivirga endophytica]
MSKKVRTDTPAGPPPAPQPLPIAVVDNHTHLDISRDDGPPPDVTEALSAAKAVGVDRVVQIGCDLEGARFTVQQVEQHAQMLGGVAIHPNEAAKLADAGELDAAWAEIERLAAHPRIRVIGETGLDYFRTGPEGVAAQQDSFRWHIDLAKRTGKALQIHDRDAHGDVMRILDEEGAPESTVMHCFSGDINLARRCVDKGYFLSFSGTVTFKNARDLRDALSIVPLDRLLVETDAPYLTPAPHRGATNSPYLIPLTVRAMADVLAVDVPTLCQALSGNSEQVYGSWAV